MTSSKALPVACLLCASLLLNADVARSDFLIQSFETSESDATGNWDGFGFKVNSQPVEISGLSYIDFGEEGLASAVTVKLWQFVEGNFFGTFTELASLNFSAGSGAASGTLFSSPSNFQVANSPTDPTINGFRYKLFADDTFGSDADTDPDTLTLSADNGSSDYIYILGALNSNDVEDTYFQSVSSGSGPLGLDIGIGSQFTLLSSLQAMGQVAPDNNPSTFGLTASESNGFPAFNNFTSSGIVGGDPDFNPIGPNIVFGDLTPEQPVVPEPSSFILCGLAALLSALFMRKRRTVVLQG